MEVWFLDGDYGTERGTLLASTDGYFVVQTSLGSYPRVLTEGKDGPFHTREEAYKAYIEFCTRNIEEWGNRINQAKESREKWK